MVCVVYPWTPDDSCYACTANEWSYYHSRFDMIADQVPQALAGRVPLDLWYRLLDGCHEASRPDYLYYKYGFGLGLMTLVLLVFILAPTLGLVWGVLPFVLVGVPMAVVQRILAIILNRKLSTLIERLRPEFEATGCSIEWRCAWVGGMEALSRHVWVEIIAGGSLHPAGGRGAAGAGGAGPGAPTRAWEQASVTPAAASRIAPVRPGREDAGEGRAVASGDSGDEADSVRRFATDDPATESDMAA